jgi:hypothetical protein
LHIKNSYIIPSKIFINYILNFLSKDHDRGQHPLVPQVNPPPEIPEDDEDDDLAAKTESSFSVSLPLQWGHSGFLSASDIETTFSNRLPHFLHLYS